MRNTLGLLVVTMGLLAGGSALGCDDSSISDQATRDGVLRVHLVQQAAHVGDVGPGDMMQFIRQWSYRPPKDAPTWNDSFAWARNADYGRINMERYIGQWSYAPASASAVWSDGYAWARDPLGYGTDTDRFIRQWSYRPDSGPVVVDDGYGWARSPGAHGRAQMERYIGQWGFEPDSALTWTDDYTWARGPMLSVQACAALEVDELVGR